MAYDSEIRSWKLCNIEDDGILNSFNRTSNCSQFGSSSVRVLALLTDRYAWRCLLEFLYKPGLFLALKGGTKLVQDLISVITVRSFARFAPSPVKLKFPEFLNNIAVVDWTNETTFDVICQR